MSDPSTAVETGPHLPAGAPRASDALSVEAAPVGATIVALCVAMATGGLAARSLHEAQPVLAIALAPALGLGLYALVRLMNVAKASLSVRSMAIVFATGFAMIYYLVLAGETYRPHRSSDPIVRLEQGLTLLLWLFGAAAVPIAIAAIGAWRAGGATRRHVRPGARAPFFVTVGLGAATFSVSMGILVAAMAVLPRAAYVYALLAILFVLPLAFHSVQTYLYGRILSRWEVESIPDPLVRALAELRSRCSFQFDRVICLDAGYSNGRVAAVTSSIRSATLLLSEPLVGLLDRDELLAVLAHETAHVELNHVRRKLIFGVLATAIGITSYTLVSVGLDQILPRDLRLARVLLLGPLLSVGRRAYDLFVTRKHECEADVYAARAAGAGALLRALEKLGASRDSTRIANRWTTHSTWETRSRRLRNMAAREGRDERSRWRD